MPSILRYAATGVLIVVSISASVAWPAPVVVETPALSPDEQKTKFKLPPGFEIQLVASEPDIGKPMNLSFDARGRLWVTHSLEYPFPTAGEGVQPRDLNQDQITDHAPRDHLSYFESIGPDGRGKGLVHFAEGLNIPIGQIPLVDSHQETAALGYSIPSLRLYQRSSETGLAETSQVLFTGFGNVDTHGMCNSFTRAFDGWVYACHGFRNTSHIARPGGDPLLSLNSGNTIRFRPDGSDLEQFTKGQVNPFGMTFDTWGNLYNADCHSMPVTQLIRGATYQSFGKPDEGLGFGPNMIDHNHGSTGICGVAWYDAPQFPEEFRDCLYICNPVNGQVHRDKLVWTGASPKVSSQPEFITCDDGWFRPVDVKLGPDGALYIADFYNAIIGHYEAPLQHPLRDRTHARIWRVVYTGDKGGAAPGELADLTTRSDAELAAALGDPNFALRTLATNLLVDRYSPPISRIAGERPDVDREPVLKELEGVLQGGPSRADHVVHAAWAWARLLPPSRAGAADLLSALARHQEPIVRAHVARIAGATEQPQLVELRGPLLAALLKDSDPRVRRTAVESLALHPDATTLPLLLDTYVSTEEGDSHLQYAIRVALRARLLKDGTSAEELAAMAAPRQYVLAGVAPAVNPMSASQAEWLRDLVIRTAASESEGPQGEWRQWIKPAARYSEGAEFVTLQGALVKASGDNLSDHLANARAALSGRQAGGLAVPPTLTVWAERLALQFLAEASAYRDQWTYLPLPGARPAKSPFGMQPRAREGKRGRTPLLSSFPGGEQATGINRSAPFEILPKFSFWLAGHNGRPPGADSRQNLVRLVDARTGECLREAFPPRNDVAQLVEWDLSEFAGRSGAIEIVDAHTGDAFAWIAAGRFSRDQLNPPAQDSGATAVGLIKDFRLASLVPRLDPLLLSENRSLRTHAATALVALEPDARTSTLLLWADDSDLPASLQSRLWEAVRTRDAASVVATLRDLLIGAATDRQRKVAESLVSDRAGADLLLSLAEEGRLSLVLLQQPGLKFRLAALNAPELTARAEELTKSLPAPDLALALLIAKRKSDFDPGKCSTDNGKAAFTKRCAVCHQIGTEGAKVGPQLDGVGIRGVDRLLEDILDPNRNVDAAFRSSAIALSDGRILTGLKRGEDGADLIFANSEGKEFRIPSADIDEMKLSPTSLMPGNFGELIPPEEMADILAWLLTQRPAGK
ncbi:DUF7133 domain-containing protein [Caulifigura coniformis]|nr:HEAT repeat domain-containing protein [Caulifigura coniformis]